MSDSFSACLKNCKVSPKKARLVALQVRGMSVNKATTLLKHMSNKSAVLFFKLIQSLSSNIENNHGQDYGDFTIVDAFASKGQTLKRIRTRAKGRADRRLKRFSHLYVTAQSK